MRGARTSCYGIDPDVGVAIDVTFATDSPGIDKRKIGDISVGKGPVITRGPIINQALYETLISIAKKEKIPYQLEAAASGTGTDANVMHLTRSGVPVVLVSIPSRYMHTPVELVSLKDLANTIRLVSSFIIYLQKNGIKPL